MPDDNHYAHPLDMVVNLVSTHAPSAATAPICSATAMHMLLTESHCLTAQDMNTRKVVAIWHHEGTQYQVPRVNSNFHRELIERPWRTGLKPLDIVQVRCSVSLAGFLQGVLSWFNTISSCSKLCSNVYGGCSALSICHMCVICSRRDRRGRWMATTCGGSSGTCESASTTARASSCTKSGACCLLHGLRTRCPPAR